MSDSDQPRPTRREQLRRLGKLRILFAALFMILLGCVVTILLDKTEGKPPPEPPHQIIDQAK